jgi:hypothetical protein
MLPVALCELGWSSFCTSERTRFRRAGLAARTIRLLLRFSGITVVRNEVSATPCCPGGTPGVAAPPDSASRWTMGARSAARACCSGSTSTSVAFEMSSAAMMRASRCRLSA